MAPKEPIHLPLRWQFVPMQSERAGLVNWRWQAFTQAGALAMESKEMFDSLTECMNDARLHGYETK